MNHLHQLINLNNKQVKEYEKKIESLKRKIEGFNYLLKFLAPNKYHLGFFGLIPKEIISLILLNNDDIPNINHYILRYRNISKFFKELVDDILEKGGVIKYDHKCSDIIGKYGRDFPLNKFWFSDDLNHLIRANRYILKYDTSNDKQIKTNYRFYKEFNPFQKEKNYLLVLPKNDSWMMFKFNLGTSHIINNNGELAITLKCIEAGVIKTLNSKYKIEPKCTGKKGDFERSKLERKKRVILFSRIGKDNTLIKEFEIGTSDLTLYRNINLLVIKDILSGDKNEFYFKDYSNRYYNIPRIQYWKEPYDSPIFNIISKIKHWKHGDYEYGYRNNRLSTLDLSIH